MTKIVTRLNRQQIEVFCKKHHIVYLALFGSVLSSNFTKKSDVDVLVKFKKQHTPHLLDMVRIESELSNLIGYPVDLKTPNDLSPYFRENVLNEAEVVYRK